MQQGCHRIEMMMAVDDIRACSQRIEIVGYRHARSGKLVRYVSKSSAESEGRVTAFQQTQGEIAHVQLSARATRQRIVGD